MNVAAMVLAAGASTRLGSPKQLLAFQGRSLLRRAAESALAIPCAPVIVVLGAGAETLRAELAGLPVSVALNPDWERGLGSSIRCGMNFLSHWEKQISPPDAAGNAPKGLDGVLLLLCDQPLVGEESLRRIVTAFEWANSPAAIAAAAYDGTVGVPALFGHAYFDELRALPADAGAKPLLRRHSHNVLSVPLSEAATDIDTQEQYKHLLALPSVELNAPGRP